MSEGIEEIPVAAFLNQRFLVPQLSPDTRWLGWLESTPEGMGVRITPTAALSEGTILAPSVQEFRFLHRPDEVLVTLAEGSLLVYNLALGAHRELLPSGSHPSLVGVSPDVPDQVVLTLNEPHPLTLYTVHLESGESEMLRSNPGGRVAKWLLDPRLLEPTGGVLIETDATRVLDLYLDQTILEVPITTDLEVLAIDGGVPIIIAPLSGPEIHAHRVERGRALPVDPNAPQGMDLDTLYVHPVRKQLQFAKYRRDLAIEWRWLDEDPLPRRWVTELIERLGTPDLSIARYDSTDQEWLVTASYTNRPSMLYRYSPYTTELVPLIQEYELPPIPQHGVQVLSLQVHPGVEASAFLHRAQDTTGPLVLLVHGGPWEHVEGAYAPLIHLLLSRGHPVLVPNFRGSTGYGQPLLDAGNGEWGEGMVADLVGFLTLALRTLDTPSWVVLGHSYGGYASLMMTMKQAGVPLPTKGVALMPPTDLLQLRHEVPEAWAPILTQLDARMGSWDERLIATSPINLLERICSPLFVVAGTEDEAVPLLQVERFVAAARERNLSVEYHRLEGCGHLLEESPYEVMIWTRVMEFIHSP